jgi:hypothetical protein
VLAAAFRPEPIEDWTRWREEGVRYHSGMATYRKIFDAPRAKWGERYLDLGEVKNVAGVRLNEKHPGDAWTTPLGGTDDERSVWASGTHAGDFQLELGVLTESSARFGPGIGINARCEVAGEDTQYAEGACR